MNTKIIVVRHAQSTGNLLAEFHGQYRSDITDLGVKQAECTSKFLKDYEIDLAFASDIPRAFHTTQIVAQPHGIEVVGVEGLREVCAGEWEQMPFNDISVKYPEEYRVWREDLGNARCPGGESVRELQTRVKATIENIVKENPGKNILIGTHATPIRVMACIWHGLPLEKVTTLPWVPNASVSIINYDSETLEHSIESYALCEHLLKKNLVTELPKNI